MAGKSVDKKACC